MADELRGPVTALPPTERELAERARANMAKGQLERGNINLHNRPVVKNPDGSISTVRSMSIGVDGKEMLVPTVSDDGRIMSNQEAIDQYRRTGQHLGAFSTPEDATAYGKTLSGEQAEEYLK